MESSRRLAVVDKICSEIEFQGLEQDGPIVSPGSQLKDEALQIPESWACGFHKA